MRSKATSARRSEQGSKQVRRQGLRKRNILNRKTEICVAVGLFFGLVTLLAHGQDYGRSVARPSAVEYLFPEQVTVPAGKASPVALHFRIATGLHINSHAPREAFLIPTVLSIPEGSGVRLE